MTFVQFAVALVSLISILFLFLFIFYQISQLINAFNPLRVPYLPSPTEKIGNIVEKKIGQLCDDTSDKYFVELGSGLSGMSRRLSTTFKWRGVFAVDIDRVTLFAARILDTLSLNPGRDVHYIKSNIFNFNAPVGSVVYCYLNPHIMEKLYGEKKFEGMYVISATFSIPLVDPTEKIEVGGYIRNVYIYDLRKKSVES